MDEKVTARNERGTKVLKPNILYFAPCGLSEGVGGSARLRNMLDVLERLEAKTQLISYLPGDEIDLAKKLEYVIQNLDSLPEVGGKRGKE